MKKHTTPPAKKTTSAPVVAACVFEIESDGNTLKVLPSGTFRARDGRPFDAPHWYLDGTLAARLIDLINNAGIDLVIDYEHQTLNAPNNGQPAPAAGWFKTLEWREGDGLYSTDVRWTDRAKAMIKDHEYRYISPVFLYAEQTGAVLQLLHIAITNNPALDMLPDLQQQAAACFHLAALADRTAQENPGVNREQLIAHLRLSAEATDEEIEAALTQLQSDNTSLTERLAAATSQSGTNAVDLSQYVPIAVVNDMRTQIATLSAQTNTQSLESLVDKALKEGRLFPAQKQWALDLGKQNMAALTSYLGTASPIAALNATQTGGKPPAKAADEDGNCGLTVDQLAICKNMGLAPKEYAANLNHSESV